MPASLTPLFPFSDVVDNLFQKQLSLRVEDALGFLQSRELNEQLILRLLDMMLAALLPEMAAP